MEQPSSQQMDIPSESIERELSSAPAEPILGLANDSAPSVMVVDSSAFSPAYDDSLCDALSKAGCRVTLASSQPHSPDFRQSSTFDLWNRFYRARYASTSRVAKLIKGGDHFFGMRRFTSKCEALQPSVIHFQWLPLPLIDKIYLRKLRKIAPLVLTLHNTTLFHGSPTSRLQGFGFRSVFRYFDAIIVHTEFSKNKILERGWCPADKIHVVPHGVLECYREPAIGEANSGQTIATGKDRDSGEQTVLFFGHVRPYKGVDLLIQAFAQLPPAVLASTRLVIAGKPGIDILELRELAQTLNVDHRITCGIL